MESRRCRHRTTAATGTGDRSGMGATLNTAVAWASVKLTDRATWISFKNKGDYKIGRGRQGKLFKPNMASFWSTRAKIRRSSRPKAIDWILGSEGQAAIASY